MQPNWSPVFYMLSITLLYLLDVVQLLLRKCKMRNRDPNLYYLSMEISMLGQSGIHLIFFPRFLCVSRKSVRFLSVGVIIPFCERESVPSDTGRHHTSLHACLDQFSAAHPLSHEPRDHNIHSSSLLLSSDISQNPCSISFQVWNAKR